ncbi:MAG: hypothetical protein PHH54_02905 [Candidatus Nanoarchaeia archaeon]|nr:hypothetical protein [Candidatus Nanoarchaeia archaeon]MDD5740909.1 hypothetical protein [Candidatus Nanoarchaeia archaeon]
MNKRGNNKKAQQVFGMSFGVIFSIILIVFILAVAIIAITHFLDLKKCAQISMFKEDIQTNVDKAWNSDKFTDPGNVPYSLPSNLDYVCFANLSNPFRGEDAERDIYSDIMLYEFSKGNMFLYPIEKSCDTPFANIKHLDINQMTESKNPYCIPVKKGKITIKINKEFNEGLVKLS